ncbi:pyridoxal-phosphate dependent enzyme [Oxalobacteraceae bacterium]|nr:pyridoxal-phosphate dependent enzyme [Oxalobacteraceae bacterium]
MTPLHIATPLLEHRTLSAALNKRVLLKMENTQPSGSFKLRGIGLMCQRAVAQGASHLVCPSGGNAGFATAVAGVALGVRTTILVPQTTPLTVRRQIADLGATVIVHGEVWDSTNLEARRLADQAGTIYIPPFDHPDIWEGHATLVDEALRQSRALGLEIDVVVCSVGGGGLMSGILQGLHQHGLTRLPLIAVETEGAASLRAAIDAGELVTLPAITSIASTLGAKRVAAEAFGWTQRHDVRSVLVSDAQAIDAARRFANDQRVLVEPACGAALAVAYDNLPQLAGFQCPLIVVCGGIGVDLKMLAQ